MARAREPNRLWTDHHRRGELFGAASRSFPGRGQATRNACPLFESGKMNFDRLAVVSDVHDDARSDAHALPFPSAGADAILRRGCERYRLGSAIALHDDD